MKLVVATDIHGPTLGLQNLLNQLGPIEMLSPLGHEGLASTSEQEAVAQFLARGGIVEYAHRIAASVQGQPVILVGFSVGATSAWHYLASAQCHPDSVAVLYYGSRIRDAVQLVPRCQTHLIFAEYESSFNPIDLRAQFSSEQVEFILASGQHHGCMNPLHPRFDSAYAHQQVTWLSELQRTLIETYP